MIRTLWNFLTSIKLTFYLIAAITFFLFAGGSFCLYDYAFFNTMNGVPIQRWFMEHGVRHLWMTWWIPLLFLCFTGLGANLFACAIDRIAQLWPKRSKLGFSLFFTQLIPSLVHLVFLAILAGHFLTFTAGYQVRIPVAEGQTVTAPGFGPVSFHAIQNIFYSEGTMLRGRKAQVVVHATIGGTEQVKLVFADYLSRGCYALHLDMNMREGKAARIEPRQKLDETCNQSELYNKKAQMRAEAPPVLYLQVTRDPGLALTITGLALIIALMGWYFFQVYARRGKPQVD